MEISSSKSPSHLPTLDGWRAIAILAVIACHADWPNAALAPYGAMGVSVFFALSGFLITRRLMEEWRGGGRIDLRSFYLRRAFRILPPILVYLAAVSVLGLGLRLIPMDLSQLAASLFFYRNYLTSPNSQAWYTGHFWSLAVEEHFYLIWPALLALAGLRRARWVALGLVVVVAVWRVADIHFDIVGSLNPQLRGSVARTDYRLDTLLFGCLLALLWDYSATRAIRDRTGGSLLAIGAAAGAGWCQAYTPAGYLSWVAMLMALLPAATVAKPRSWLGLLLEWRPLVWMGRLSYSLYVWQQLFLPAHELPRALGAFQRAPWNLAAILACAAASFYWVERPAIAYGKRFRRGS